MKYLICFTLVSALAAFCGPSAANASSLFAFGGGQPTTAKPAPCGLGPVAIDEQLNVTAEAVPGQIVFQVSVMTKAAGATWAHTCGGALITKQAVLTSASCVDGMNAGFVRVEGAIVDLPKGGFVRRRRFTYPGQLTPGLQYTEKIVKHPEYNKATGQNNLAVLRLAAALDIAKSEGKLNTVCDAESPLSAAATTADEPKLFVSGWGNIVPGTSQLRAKLQLKPIEKIECPVYRNDNEFCATQAGECEGDMGGPVFTENLSGVGSQLIGVTSRGTKCSAENPMIYTEVYPYMAWIKDASKPYY